MNAARLAINAGCAVALALSTSSALAQDPPGPAAQSQHRTSLGPAVSDAELAAQSGGADVQLNDLRAKAVVTDNYAGNLTTGNNVISDQALRNAAGVPMVVQNTGNNVSIQNSTILNLRVQ